MMTTFHSDPVELLKAMWRGNAAMSNLLPLEGKLAAIEAAKAGATPTEAMYFGQGYRLPTGWGWDRVAEVRAAHHIASYLVPVALGGPAIAWGVPMIEGRFLQRPRGPMAPRVFYRANTFYVIELPDDDDLNAHAEANPGTVRIEDMFGNVLWPEGTEQ